MGQYLAFLLISRGRFGSQPQRDVGGLHRLPYHAYQFAVQCLQIHLIPEFHGEALKRFSRVVLPPVETPIYERLDTPPHRAEKRRYQQRGGNYRQGGLLAGEDDEHALQYDDAAEVERDQRDGKRAVDEGTVYEDVDVEEACPQDRDPDGERDEQHKCVHKQHAQHLRSYFFGREVYRCTHSEYGCQGASNRYGHTENYPLGLLALCPVGDARVAVELGHWEAAPHHQ